MEDVRMQDDSAPDRVAEAVRHALRLVGPAERGGKRVREAPRNERSAGA